jgi:hypothetical protein
VEATAVAMSRLSPKEKQLHLRIPFNWNESAVQSGRATINSARNDAQIEVQARI